SRDWSSDVCSTDLIIDNGRLKSGAGKYSVDGKKTQHQHKEGSRGLANPFFLCYKVQVDDSTYCEESCHQCIDLVRMQQGNYSTDYNSYKNNDIIEGIGPTPIKKTFQTIVCEDTGKWNTVEKQPFFQG